MVYKEEWDLWTVKDFLELDIVTNIFGERRSYSDTIGSPEKIDGYHAKNQHCGYNIGRAYTHSNDIRVNLYIKDISNDNMRCVTDIFKTTKDVIRYIWSFVISEYRDDKLNKIL
jgi:hypothetical protein